jgi:hypothetical protein
MEKKPSVSEFNQRVQAGYQRYQDTKSMAKEQPSQELSTFHKAAQHFWTLGAQAVARN